MSGEISGGDSEKCTLVCGNIKFEADKNVLMEKSRYFQAMFSSTCRESLTNRVELVGVEPKILKMILKYMEEEETPQLQGNKDDLLAMLSASDMFSMTELFESCCNQLTTIVSAENFEDIFLLNRFYHSEKFQRELISFLSLHFRELKKFVKDLLTFEEFKLFLRNENLIYTPAMCSEILNCILQWVKENSDERRDLFNELIQLLKLGDLSDEYLEYYLSDTFFSENNSILKDYLIEKASIDQINILFHKHKRLKIYNIATDMWIDAKISSNHRPIINVFHYGNYFYFITFELHEDSCSIYILRYSGDDNLRMLYNIGNIKGKFHVCSIDNGIYIINCELKDMRMGSFKTTVRYYNVVSNEKGIIGEKVLTREITKIASSHTHIYMLSTNRTPLLFIMSFNVKALTWFELANPPITPEFYMEHSTCCQDHLYILRFYKVKVKTTWDPNGPLSKEEFYKIIEGKEFTITSSGGTETHEVSINKISIFRYDQEMNIWRLKEVEQGWSYSVGFVHFHNRFLKNIPYMYLLLLNRTIIQIDPEKCEFKDITTVPDDFYSSLHFPAYYTVFCK